MNSSLQPQKEKELIVLQEQWKLLSPKKWEDFLLTPQPQINTIIRQFGDKGELVIGGFLILQLEELLSFLNLKHTMTSEQLALTVELIIEEFPFYKIADFKFFIKEVMKGKLGKIYDRIDGNMILQFLREYELRRNEQFERLNQQQSSKQFGTNLSGIEDDQVKKLKEVIGKPKPLKSIQSREVDKTVAKYLKEFEELWNEQIKEIPLRIKHQVRLIDYNNKTLDINGYINARIEENS